MREQGENKMKRKSTAVWAAVLITLGLAGLAWFAVPLGWGVLNAGNAAGLLFSAAVLAVGHCSRSCAGGSRPSACAREKGPRCGFYSWLWRWASFGAPFSPAV